MLNRSNIIRQLMKPGYGNAVLAFVLVTLTLCPLAQAERIKDIASIQGVRDNQILGYGLIVGLDGTGDSTGQVRFTEQSLRSMLSLYGVTIPRGVTLNDVVKSLNEVGASTSDLIAILEALKQLGALRGQLVVI